MKNLVKHATPSVVRYLLFVTAIELVIFGAGTLLRISDSPGLRNIYIAYAVLMFGDALVMAVCGFYIERKIKVVYWLAVTVLSLNIVLTIFDQFGLIDFLFLFLLVITLAALYFLRKELLPQ
jgi:lysylphosphatidylglycerol synthetase-like protein (DUF2156 family)